VTVTPRPDIAGTAELTGRVLGPDMRVPPSDLNAERAVLGSMLIDSDAIAQIRELLEPQDFYAERHAHLYRAAAALAERGEPIDTVTLHDQLERGPGVGRAGGLDYIAELSLAVPTAASVVHYAEIVVAHSMRRRLIGAGGDCGSGSASRRAAPRKPAWNGARHCSGCSRSAWTRFA